MRANCIKTNFYVKWIHFSSFRRCTIFWSSQTGFVTSPQYKKYTCNKWFTPSQYHKLALPQGQLLNKELVLKLRWIKIFPCICSTVNCVICSLTLYYVNKVSWKLNTFISKNCRKNFIYIFWWSLISQSPLVL